MEEDPKPKDHAYARQEALSRLIQECLNSHETGLSLATAETGSGKSFTVADIIAKRFRKAIDRGEDVSEMKFVYLTNRVADRDGWYEKELLPALEREGVEGLVRTKNLPSMRDVAIENMTAFSDGKLGVVEGALEALPDSVKNSSQKKTLANEVMNYCVAYNAVLAGDAAPEAKKTAMDHVADAERSFRKLVSREAAKAKKALEEAENGGREGKKMDWDQFFVSERGEEWRWIKEFWRTYDAKDANVLVATYKKAFYSIDPIAGSPFTIANPEYLSKCEALFIDEIDAFYKILLDHYIEQALDYVCDLPEHIAATSRALHAALTVVEDDEESYLTDLVASLPQDDKIPSRIMDLQASSPALPASYMLLRECVFLNVHGVSNKNIKTMLGAIKGLENVDRLLVELCEEFNLSAQHVDLTSENETAGFIFVDPIRERPVLSSEARSLAVERHAAENRIVKAASTENREESSPTMMLKRLRGANRSLQHALCSAVLAMRACYSEALEKNSESDQRVGGSHLAKAAKYVESEMQYQTQSLLNELRLPCAGDRGFVSSCTRIAWERGRPGKEEQFDNSIYSNGATLYKFTDAPSHQFHTAMCLYDLSMTPELWLVSAAQSTNVIGMSATALCDSALNFSFGYLAEKLGGIDYGSEAARASLVGASEANRERAKAAYDVKVDVIGDVIDDVNRLEKKDFWLSWAATVGAPKEEMKAAWAVGEDHPTLRNYELQRWANAAWAIKAFWESGARAGVAFVPQATGPVTKKFLKELCEQWGVPAEAVKDIYSAGWDEGFLKVRAELAEGKRIIVVTTYQTAAEGKNLTYPIPDGAEGMVRLYDNEGKERDFDFLYFDKPTNVLISSAKCDAEKLKGAYEQERLAERGEISMQERFTRIKRLLSGKEGEAKENIPIIPINKLRSLSNGTAALVNQGAGRISRTPNKSKTVTILLNGALARTMSADAFEGQPVGNEFDCICKRLSGWKAENEDRRTDSEPDDSGYKMAMTADMIRLCLDAFSYDRGGAKFNMAAEKAVRTWDAMRNWVLAHPTPSDLDFEENRAMSRFYVRVAPGSGALRYQEKDDFKRCGLLKPGEQAEKGWRAGEVSAGAARLGSLTRNSVIRSHMESRGYATEWDMDSPWRMTPILFQNIYKGALGEAAGEALFGWLSEQTGEDMALDRMETDPARFEIFDFELRPGSGIYVDMKHWKADVPKKGEEGVEKALRKLGENGVGGRMAVYINAIGSKGAGWVPATRGDGKVVTIPGIIDEETGDFLLENVNYLLNELKKAI